MTYRVPLPEGSRRPWLDIIEPKSTATQRFIRSHGLGRYETSTAAALLAWCEAHDPGFVLFDIGANMGLYGHLAASVFSPAVVHSFEPSPMAADVVRKIARRNKLAVTTHEIALSDRSGYADLFVTRTSDALNSLVEGFHTFDDTVRVGTRTLDAVVDELGIAPGLVKLDVETHERAVLDGGHETFKRHRPALIVEVLRRKGRDHGEEISSFFDGLGYSFFELSAAPTWLPQEKVRGSGTNNRDWIGFPGSLPETFPEAWAKWHARHARCDRSALPRLPLLATTAAAYRRGGASEVLGSARRFTAERRSRP